MKILFPIGSFYPSQSGGPNNTIYWITKQLSKNNYEPIIVTTINGIKSDHNIEINKWLNKDYGQVIYTDNPIHYLPLKAIYQSVKKIKEVDLIHLTSIFYPLSILIAIINLLFYKKPIIWSPRGELDKEALIYSPIRKKTILWFINTFLKKKITFHTTCREESQYVSYQFGEKARIKQIPNYIDIPKLEKTNKQKYFLYIGRIHPKKAIENLIKALNISKLFINSNFNFIIAGDYDSNYGHSLIKLSKTLQLEHKIKFIGHIDKTKQQILAQAYFSFMPSHTENFGNVVVEALAQKTPVVASKGTPWKILIEKKAGYWVENSPKTLSITIDEILNFDSSKYNKLSQNAYNLAINEFDIKNNIHKWIQVYSSLIYEK